ncbi:MAG: biopolymer transporter ExbD [Opitutales bacterium]|jgi:biopolymer transport protein ExbD|nr:biopolymer transporter ExbD [Opitutales bacterium]MBP3357704.1 biopolymer transporter ExbD [Opitutales bacterium]MBQ2722802.1 biopolymer transporter ExbD [Opitutales bacterium]MBR7106243.1 biopolymer transporter ExbD [Opitutales bacterium]
MKFRSRKAPQAMTDLNITPLMDLAFSLLIIFMISTPLLEQTIPVHLPKQDQNSASERPKIDFQVITINENGQIYWGKQPVDLVQLDSLLATLASQPEPPAISFRGDFSLPYQKIVDVISAIKRHNLKKLHLDTEVK